MCTVQRCGHMANVTNGLFVTDELIPERASEHEVECKRRGTGECIGVVPHVFVKH